MVKLLEHISGDRNYLDHRSLIFYVISQIKIIIRKKTQKILRSRVAGYSRRSGAARATSKEASNPQI
uniref:Uncharacterized protein n=1 Tax=Rhizophora mucronata TaxID=61149 RepID=A0A2P2NMJ6_RHIMU